MVIRPTAVRGLIPMGMNKSGTFSVPAYSTTKVTGGVVEGDTFAFYAYNGNYTAFTMQTGSYLYYTVSS